MPLTEQDRAENGRVGGAVSQRRTLEQLRQHVDPAGAMPESERERLAREARRERMAELGRSSGRVRSEHAARAKLDAHIAALVDEAPPLTPEQVAKLRTLLGLKSAQVRGGDAA